MKYNIFTFRSAGYTASERKKKHPLDVLDESNTEFHPLSRSHSLSFGLDEIGVSFFENVMLFTTASKE